jgi:hypothetical protein
MSVRLEQRQCPLRIVDSTGQPPGALLPVTIA